MYGKFYLAYYIYVLFFFLDITFSKEEYDELKKDKILWKDDIYYEPNQKKNWFYLFS